MAPSSSNMKHRSTPTNSWFGCVHRSSRSLHAVMRLRSPRLTVMRMGENKARSRAAPLQLSAVSHMHTQKQRPPPATKRECGSPNNAAAIHIAHFDDDEQQQHQVSAILLLVHSKDQQKEIAKNLWRIQPATLHRCSCTAPRAQSSTMSSNA